MVWSSTKTSRSTTFYFYPSIVKFKWNGQMEGIVDKKKHIRFLLEYS